MLRIRTRCSGRCCLVHRLHVPIAWELAVLDQSLDLSVPARPRPSLAHRSQRAGECPAWETGAPLWVSIALLVTAKNSRSSRGCSGRSRRYHTRGREDGA